MKAQSHPPVTLLRVAIPFVLGLILSNAECARDVTDPGVLDVSTEAALSGDENLVPNETVSNPGGWYAIPGGGLWSALDEASPNDGDYIYRLRYGLPPVTVECTVGLTSPVGTPSPSQTHRVVVRWRVTGNYSTSTPEPTLINFALLEGANVLKQRTILPTGSSYRTDTLFVDGDDISNYPALRIRFYMILKPATQFDQIEGRISWARMEIR